MMSDRRIEIRTAEQKRKVIIKAIIKLLISAAVVVLALWILGVF